MKTTANRETWLEGATRALRPLFESKGHPYPATPVRVSCSLPSKSALSAKARRIGECWSPSASKDGTTEIFVSPTIDDPVEVLEILVHELVHYVVGVEHGHRKPFGKCARAVGLEGRLTSTHAGSDLRLTLKRIAERLGAYPHAALRGSNRPKQSTRLVKVSCPECGYPVRVTRKWLDGVGAPCCPAHGLQMEEEG